VQDFRQEVFELMKSKPQIFQRNIDSELDDLIKTEANALFELKNYSDYDSMEINIAYRGRINDPYAIPAGGVVQT
jgi:hypothetical protein